MTTDDLQKNERHARLDVSRSQVQSCWPTPRQQLLLQATLWQGEKALRAWTPERLARALSMLAQASLDARKESDLGDTIAHRALMLIARGAGRREGL